MFGSFSKGKFYMVLLMERDTDYPAVIFVFLNK